MPLYTIDQIGISGFSGTSGGSGFSGTSGTSGFSGKSGFSGTSGITGAGLSGTSGFSGVSGASTNGLSGTSGYSGTGGAETVTSYFIPKTADQENASSGLADDTELKFSILSGETWSYEFYLIMTNVNSATPDWKAAVKGVNGWTGYAHQAMCEYSGIDGPCLYTTDIDAAPTALANINIAADANIPMYVHIQGVVTANSNGTLTLQWAAYTAGASVWVLAGSFLLAQKSTGTK